MQSCNISQRSGERDGTPEKSSFTAAVLAVGNTGCFVNWCQSRAVDCAEFSPPWSWPLIPIAVLQSGGSRARPQ